MTTLPGTITRYLTAHESRDADTALETFAPTAEVVDDGTTYRGTAEIRDFLTNAGARFSYTSTLVGAERTDDAHWVATLRLVGDFPGGTVDLRHRFTLAGDRIAELVIAP